MKDLYSLVAGACGSDQAPDFAERKPGEQRRSVLDPGELMRVLGITSFVPLADGLAATAEWFRAHRKFLLEKNQGPAAG